jgi:hypothetical protein
LPRTRTLAGVRYGQRPFLFVVRHTLETTVRLTSFRPWPFALALILALAGCEVPGGASTPLPEDTTYKVQVPYEELTFAIATPSQNAGGVSATAMPLDLKPRLYYRYFVESHVNGGYIAMPNPPMAYVIRKVPFYKNESDAVRVRLNLHNGGNEVVRTGQAVCSFDIDGKTVVSVPLGTPDLLPGHDVSVMAQGPALEAFDAGKGSGTLTVWLYGLGADKTQTLRWDASYNVKQEVRDVPGQVLGTTSSEDDAKRYEGREEPAVPDAAGGP